METPKDLTALEYSRHLLEEILAWPAKGNIELVADCLTAISKSKRLPLPKAHGYMERAIRLAREQNVEIDRFWFQNGDYMNMRPTVKHPADREMELRERYRRHGCEGGWVYQGAGVVRCPQCADESRRGAKSGNSDRGAGTESQRPDPRT
jgi:hypothetical protein